MLPVLFTCSNENYPNQVKDTATKLLNLKGAYTYLVLLRELGLKMQESYSVVRKYKLASPPPIAVYPFFEVFVEEYSIDPPVLGNQC